jgi:hypothetical protein
MKTVNGQLQDVEEYMNQGKSRSMFERYQTIRLYLLGHNNQQIAAVINRAESTGGNLHSEVSKSDVINNVFYHTTAEIRKNVKTFMDSIMKDPLAIIDRLCIRMQRPSFN